MKEYFEDRRFTGSINVACKFDDGTVRYWAAEKLDVVNHIISIVNEYIEMGERLTLRQLHYQLVTKSWIVNHDTAYKKLGTILDDLRYAGKIDWAAIEDRGRRPFIEYSVDDIPDALQDTIDSYKLNRQRGQEAYVELWTEKDALSGILSKSTNKYHVKLIVNKGYTSSSAAYTAYQRCLDAIKNGQRVVILYFGDHDPSGLDMIRDIRERLMFFLCRGSGLNRSKEVLDHWMQHKYDVYDAAEITENDRLAKIVYEDPSDKDVEDFDAAQVQIYLRDKHLFEVKPIGLTMDQIKKYKLPPNPTKLTDTRADKYIKQFGKTCWEVDALKPEVLRQIVETNIERVIDVPLYNKVVVQENKEIKELTKILKSTIDKGRKK